MADSAFDLLAQALEESSSLSRIEARGTLRLALKLAGIDPSHPSVDQLEVVLRKVLPRELMVRGINDGVGVCASLAERASEFVDSSGAADSPEDVFRRLGS